MNAGGWEIKNEKLEKTFTFSNFRRAVEFINIVTDAAESSHHHPDIHLENYKFVRIVLFTHSENKVTDKDHLLAKKIDSII